MYYAKKSGSRSYTFFRPEMGLAEDQLVSKGHDLWHTLDWYELKTGSTSTTRPVAEHADD